MLRLSSDGGRLSKYDEKSASGDCRRPSTKEPSASSAAAIDTSAAAGAADCCSGRSNTAGGGYAVGSGSSIAVAMAPNWLEGDCHCGETVATTAAMAVGAAREPAGTCSACTPLVALLAALLACLRALLAAVSEWRLYLVRGLCVLLLHDAARPSWAHREHGT